MNTYCFTHTLPPNIITSASPVFGKVFYFLPKGSLSIVMLRIDRPAVPLMYLFSELNEAYR